MKLFWNFHPKPETVSELKVTLEMGEYSAGTTNKAVPSITNSLKRVRER